MGAANPPRVGCLASPFGAYDFGAALGAAAAAAAAAAGNGDAGGSPNTAVVRVSPNGSWAVPSLEASLALASGSLLDGSGAGSVPGPLTGVGGSGSLSGVRGGGGSGPRRDGGGGAGLGPGASRLGQGSTSRTAGP
jgi:hypothetical protein